MKLNWKRVIAVFIVFALMVGVLIYFLVLKNDKEDVNQNVDNHGTAPEEKKLQILNLDSNSRPISVMINNHKIAQPLQTGLNDAYLVYEIVVEGGITRMLAVYKDADTTRIGTIRSSRHYFLDYAQENDAVYVHFGWSPQAENDIKNLKINNINGMIDGGAFWRDKSLNVATEHTVYTSIEKLESMIDKKNYTSTSTKSNLLNYSIDEIDLSQMEDAKKADNVKIVYSTYQTNDWQYDSGNKVYYKLSNGTKRVDYITKKPFTAKNIITYQVRNYTMDSSKGRQEIENIGKGNGYYISNGYAVPITWEKTSPSSQTIYKYLDGKEITVNDGNTYIQIQPKNQKIEISENLN